MSLNFMQADTHFNNIPPGSMVLTTTKIKFALLWPFVLWTCDCMLNQGILRAMFFVHLDSWAWKYYVEIILHSDIKGIAESNMMSMINMF